TPFPSDDLVYTGNFAKIELNVAHRPGQPGDALPDMLQSRFGADAGQPGTVQYVELLPGQPHWQMGRHTRSTAVASLRVVQLVAGPCFQAVGRLRTRTAGPMPMTNRPQREAHHDIPVGGSMPRVLSSIVHTSSS